MKKQIVFFVLILLFSSTLFADVDSLVFVDPTQGFPTVLTADAPDTMAIVFQALDETGAFVSGLTMDEFTVYFDLENCENVSLVEGANVYTLRIVPYDFASEGTFTILLLYDDGTKDTVEICVVDGVMYTFSPLIENGLLWLKWYRNTDGSWNYNSQSHNLGITALALQAYLGRGYDVYSPVHGDVVYDAINFILTHQWSGPFYTLSGSLMYENCMAIVALVSALKTNLPADLDSLITNALPAALAYITDPVVETWDRVSWRYNSGYTSQDSGDMSVNQWAYLALEGMEYTDKDIWNKIYNYMDYHKGTDGTSAWLGYQANYTRPRGNTMAAIWGLNLAANHGVAAATSLADKCYYYVTNGYTPTSLISAYDLHNQCVYSGAGYYYYIYEFAKAFALGGKTQIHGENWYNTLYSRIDGQHWVDAANDYYYWRTSWTDPTGYYIAGSGLGDHGNTALALLALEVGTVPDDSRITVKLHGARDDELHLIVYDGDGKFAGVNEYGVWVTEIPNSQWISTGAIQELSIDLAMAANLTVEIYNTGNDSSNYEIIMQSFVGDNMTSEFTHAGVVQAQEILGTSVTINAIGGLTIYTSPPEEFPNMMLSLDSKTFDAYAPGQGLYFNFDIMEIGGAKSLYDIDIYADDLVDSYGNIVPSDSILINPTFIDSISASGQETVYCVITVPMDIVMANTYSGKIYAEASGIGRKSISLYLAPDSLVLDVVDDTGGFPASGSSTVKYTINYGNPLTTTLYGVDIFDQLPDTSYMIFKDCSGSGVYDTDNHLVYWHFDELQAGEINQQAWVEVTVNPNLADTATVMNNVSLSSDLPTIYASIATSLIPMSTIDEPYFRPNPFNPELYTGETFPNFDDPTSPLTKLRIYDSAGELVKEAQDVGSISLLWDGKNEYGDYVANGVYFIIVENQAGEKQIVKVAILR